MNKIITFLRFVNANVVSNKKSWYLLLLVLLILNASAQEDFAVTAQSEIDLCPCSNQAYYIYVQNNGASTSTYSVVFSGNASKWVLANPSKFSINPGVASYFLVNVNSDCGVKGSYDLNAYITAGSLTKLAKQNLNFIECYKFDTGLGNLIEVEDGGETVPFSKHDGGYSICEEEEKVLPILITNKESYGNDYVLSLKGGEWAKLNTGEAALDGNAAGIALVSLEPGEGTAGDYKLNFDAVTKLGNVKKSKEIDVNVKKCYGLKIGLEKEKDLVCGEASYDVKIENEGIFSEEVELGTNFEWAEIKNKTLILKGGSEKVIQLALKPDVSGSFDVEVDGFITSNPDIKASGKIKIDATSKEECYKATIDVKKETINYYSEEYYNVDVINDGLKKASYNISLDGPSWASVSPDSLQLNPGQKGNLNLYVGPEEDIKADNYKIVLKLDSYGVVYSEELNVKLIKESKIIKSVKSFVSYFQYYIYLIVLIAILIFIFVRPIKKQIRKVKKGYGKYKSKKKRERQRKLEKRRRAEEEEKKQKEEEERKAREEEERKADEERKKKEEEKRKKEMEKKKITEEKKAEKTAKKKKRKTKKNFIWLVVLFVLIIAGVLFLSVYFKWVDYNSLFSKVNLDVFSFITMGLKSAWAYSYYILIALAFLALIIFFFNALEKEGKVKEEKAGKKERKKKIKISKFFKSVYFKGSLAVLVLLVLLFVAYSYFYEHMKEFFTLYLYYIIAGIIILVLLILFMKFYKPIIDFLTEEER